MRTRLRGWRSRGGQRAAHLRQRRGAGHPGGGAGDLEHHIGTGIRGPLVDSLSDVLPCGIERAEAQVGDLRAAALVEFNDDDLDRRHPNGGRVGGRASPGGGG
jgi:hypothetical protein